jgi:hypothetical protein
MPKVRDGWRPHCTRCRYPLASIPDGACPECGTPFSISLLRAAHLQREPRSWLNRVSWFEAAGTILLAACYWAYISSQDELVRAYLLVFNGSLAALLFAFVVLKHLRWMSLASGVVLFASVLWLYPVAIADRERWYICFSVWAISAAAMAHRCIAIRPRLGFVCCAIVWNMFVACIVLEKCLDFFTFTLVRSDPRVFQLVWPFDLFGRAPDQAFRWHGFVGVIGGVLGTLVLRWWAKMEHFHQSRAQVAPPP